MKGNVKVKIVEFLRTLTNYILILYNRNFGLWFIGLVFVEIF